MKIAHSVIPKGFMDHHGQLCTVPRSDSLVCFFPGTNMHFSLNYTDGG